jgi:Domain of unknown function (DUF4266)
MYQYSDLCKEFNVKKSKAWLPGAAWCRVALLVLLMPLAACSQLGVQPWERELLAKPAMQLSASPLEAAIDDHIYFSKEAATGGRGFGGGGCGCN